MPSLGRHALNPRAEGNSTVSTKYAMRTQMIPTSRSKQQNTSECLSDLVQHVVNNRLHSWGGCIAGVGAAVQEPPRRPHMVPSFRRGMQTKKGQLHNVVCLQLDMQDKNTKTQTHRHDPKGRRQHALDMPAGTCEHHTIDRHPHSKSHSQHTPLKCVYLTMDLTCACLQDSNQGQ
jgi:hypothetical protein